MKTTQDIENHINERIDLIENALDLSEITIRNGLHSFRYGTSDFLSQLFNPLSLDEKSVFYDLGSGYGRVILNGALRFPKVQFKGIEILEERNTVCEELIQKMNISNASTSCANILETDISDGSVFYIFNSLYDFQYDELIDKLHAVSKTKNIVLIAESRCDVFDAVQWLTHYYTMDIDIRRNVKYYTSEVTGAF